ncbi:MAG TPA: hypothetical protein VJU59_40365, partial [Paraburkholderia sp.]|uniref:hypothetical protein n=1 Tax=Paraburkholderia sp. TaxID=1926495 RepID=UPI002B460A98
MPIGDYFAKIFGGPYRKETAMGDGSHAQTVIAVPPFDTVPGDTPISVALDEPIDVHVTNQPTVAIAGVVPVHLNDQPIAINLPEPLIT